MQSSTKTLKQQTTKHQRDDSIPLEIVKITLISKNNDFHVNSSKNLSKNNPFTVQSNGKTPIQSNTQSESMLKKQFTVKEEREQPKNKYRQLFNLKKEVVFKELPNVVGKNTKSPKKCFIMSKQINKNY